MERECTNELSRTGPKRGKLAQKRGLPDNSLVRPWSEGALLEACFKREVGRAACWWHGPLCDQHPRRIRRDGWQRHRHHAGLRGDLEAAAGLSVGHQQHHVVWERLYQPEWQPGAEGAVPARAGKRPAEAQFRVDGAQRRLGCRQHHYQGRPERRELLVDFWEQDVHHRRRHQRHRCHYSPHRARQVPGHHGVSGGYQHARLQCQPAEEAGLPRLKHLRCPLRQRQGSPQ